MKTQTLDPQCNPTHKSICRDSEETPREARKRPPKHARRLIGLICAALLLAALMLPRGAVAAGAPASADGFVTARAYMNCGPTDFLSGLLADPLFPDSPDMVVYEPYFELWATGDLGTPPLTTSSYSNYGAQMYGYFYPPATTNYTFYLCSDDNSQLFLSTDDNPANKLLIAEETTWSNPRQYTSSDGSSNLSAKRSDQFTATQWPTGNVITLTKGKPYYIEALMKQGGGGDNLSVSIDGVTPIPGNLLSSFQGNAEAQPQQVANVNNTNLWSVTVVGGVTNIVAGGLDVWDTTDSSGNYVPLDGFVFDYFPVSGDFDYRLRVLSMTDPSSSGWSKCGIMARESLTPGSPHVFCLATPPQGHDFYDAQGRDLPDFWSWSATVVTSHAGPPASFPNAWLRLRREGSIFKYYYSTDGETWQQFFTHDTSTNGSPNGLSQSLLLGIATTAHNEDALAPGETVAAQVSDFGPFFTIVQEPQPQQVVAGSTAVFSVAVTNVPPSDVQYQWLFNGAPITGATSSQLVISNVTTNDDGLYSARITYTISGDVDMSRAARLDVEPFGLNVFAAVELRFLTSLGVNYQIQASPDLKTWTNLEAPIAGTGQYISVFESTRDSSAKYYRLVSL